MHQDDITQARVDAIVNAANDKLEHHGGVAKALSVAAGPILQDESRRLVSRKGKLRVGTSVSTTAGSLKAFHVIHTVGPTLHEFRKQPDLLFSAFQSAFEEACQLDALTVAVPLISAGTVLDAKVPYHGTRK